MILYCFGGADAGTTDVVCMRSPAVLLCTAAVLSLCLANSVAGDPCNPATFRSHTDYQGGDIVDASDPPHADNARSCCLKCFQRSSCCAW